MCTPSLCTARVRLVAPRATARPRSCGPHPVYPVGFAQIRPTAAIRAQKELLLANPTFIPYLISGLILGVDHPCAGLKDDTKLWTQTMHAECFAQLALFSPGCDAMRRDPSVAEALQTVATEGLSSESRDFAKATLLAMSDEELHMRVEGQKHVMLSCESALV